REIIHRIEQVWRGRRGKCELLPGRGRNVLAGIERRKWRERWIRDHVRTGEAQQECNHVGDLGIGRRWRRKSVHQIARQRIYPSVVHETEAAATVRSRSTHAEFLSQAAEL